MNNISVAPSSSNWHARLLMLIMLASLLMLGGCECQTGATTSRPSFSVTALSVNKTAARIGDRITVRWGYNSGARLGGQTLQLLKLNPAGVVGDPINLPTGDRSYSFRFEGPVTIYLLAKETTGKVTTAAMDIKLDSKYAFRMKGVRQSHNGYPRIGMPTSGRGPIDIEFTHFFGIYDGSAPNSEDGIVDGLQVPELASVMPSNESFFGHSFSVEERDHFKFRLGSAFPVLEPGFLNTVEGGQFLGSRLQSNMVVFAGKIAYDGTETKDKKTGQTYRKNATVFESMFAAIDIRTDAKFRMFVSEITLGNVPQGLTVSVFHGETLFREKGQVLPNTAFFIPQWGQIGEISGAIKGSRLGFGVTTQNGTILTTPLGGVDVPGVYVEIGNIEWLVPHHHDSDLSGLQ